MKLIAQIKLEPTTEQQQALQTTIETVNRACNTLSQIAWKAQVFTQFPLHRLAYHAIKSQFSLSAQMVVRAISKVADAYKLDNKKLRRFKKYGAITYDDRILSFNLERQTVSIWTVEGRQKIDFRCGDRQQKLIQYRKGESDLVFHRGNFFLLVTCDLDDPTPTQVDDALGVDLGVVNIATDSTGESFSGAIIESKRRKYQTLRSALQSTGTKSAKRHLKKMSGRQKRFQKDVNHVISKHIVEKAKTLGVGIAVENLTGIHERATVRKEQRAQHSNWGFYQLKQYILYKAKRLGVPVFEIDPRNTSRECSRCGFIDKRNRKSQSEFSCIVCGFTINADYNAALNIASRAVVNLPIAVAV